MSERVLILGASSAIAQRVAGLHAARGDRLHLVARSAEKLDALARELSTAQLTRELADFSELEQNGAVIERAIATLGGIDVALIAHGELGDQRRSELDFLDAERSLRVNFTSVVSLLIPLANYFESARSGRIGVITSVAAERGRPRNYTYGAAKAGLNVYLQGLRSRLYPAGVQVTTLKLGSVDTPMTRDHEKTVVFSTPEAAARGIVAAMDGGQGEVFVPSFWAAIMPLVRNTPERLFQRLPFLSGR
jgi:decaprenylphospho-beta-D-erythro-pentofuranosid-2-ulose 2-reductase